MSATPTPPVFDPSAAHQQRPRLRPVRGFGAQLGNQMALGLADARQISDKAVFTSPAFQVVLPLMDGQKSIDDIVRTVGKGLTREPVESLIAQLDDAGLLFGPRFDEMLAKMRSDFDSSPVLPPASTAAFADALAEHTVRAKLPPEEQDKPVNMSEAEKAELGPVRLREVFDEWIAASLKDAPNPSLDNLPKAIVVPHVDYQRGWINYSSVWGRLRVADRPDRVIILGTNHFGEATGVCGCDKGYTSPLGTCDADSELIAKLRTRLGPADSEKLFANRFDHEREHSIELQIPWIQHCFGQDDAGKYPAVFAALIHDPSVNNGESYDGKGVAFEPFVSAMRDILATLPGKTLVVSSADLSHVGPQFGDEQTVAGDDGPPEEFRNKTFQHDREMIQLLAEGKADELIASMAWQQNPTRWCSIGNMIAAFKIVQPSKVHIYNYAAAMDQQGQSMVSSVGMAME